MSYDPKLGVRMAAFSLAQNALVNDVTGDQVEEVRAMAERHLDTDDVLFRAVTSFATQYEIHRHNAAQLKVMGDELVRVIQLLNLPTPPDLNRKDIHG